MRGTPLLLIALLCALQASGWAAPARPSPRTQPKSPDAVGERALDITIDRIDIAGVSSLPRSEVESALELNPGDRLERVKVIRTAENLQSIYNAQGFEQVTIKSRLLREKNPEGQLENILELTVKEGLPTRISSVRFVPENIRAESFQRYWRRIETALAARAQLEPGDLFDQNRITASKRNLKELLAVEEFVGAKVDDIRVSEATPPAAPEGATNPPAARWVALEYHVDLGDRVTFGFRGNTVFPPSRLMSLVEEQRLIGFSTDYISAIKTRTADEYRSLGYADVKVEPFTFEKPDTQERHVTYVITEGARVNIETINFDGNLVFTKAQLREEFFRQAPLQVQLGYYVAKDVTTAAELMIEWMKSKGYLSAKLVTINKAPGAEHSVRLTVYLYEGDQTIVDRVTINGAHAFTAEEVRRMLGVTEGMPLNLFSFTEKLESLKAAYRARGYLGMSLTNEAANNVIQYSHENRAAEIRLEIAEGPRYKTGKIIIEGHGKTKDEVIRRELMIREGEILTEPALLESEARLRKLGIFSIVTIRTVDEPGRPDAKTVRVSVQEGTPGVIAGGPGFRNDLGARAFGQISYANLWGKNHTLSLALVANRRLENFQFVEGQAQLAYLWPWFLNNDMTFRPTFTVTSSQFVSFSAYSTSLATTFEKRLVKSPNITGVFTYNLERIRQFNSASDIDNQDLQIGSIVPGLQLDLRDNPLSPTSGLFSTGAFELAAPWLGSQRTPFPVGYTRFQFRTDGYIPLFNDLTWFLSFRTGIERNTQEQVEGELRSGAIPAIKTFTLGGPSSLRGFQEQQLNKYSLKIGGTLSYVNYRTQLDFPFSGAMKIGPFLDAANLLADQYSLGADMRYGAGLGFHYQTPVGPVNLDWGFNLAPREGEDYWKFHFSIGVI